MSRLDEALTRLEQALVRLEAAAGSAGGTEAARRLAEVQAENARLRATAGDIAARVDGALARIGRVLGEGG